MAESDAEYNVSVCIAGLLHRLQRRTRLDDRRTYLRCRPVRRQRLQSVPDYRSLVLEQELDTESRCRRWNRLGAADQVQPGSDPGDGTPGMESVAEDTDVSGRQPRVRLQQHARHSNRRRGRRHGQMSLGLGGTRRVWRCMRGVYRRHDRRQHLHDQVRQSVQFIPETKRFYAEQPTMPQSRVGYSM